MKRFGDKYKSSIVPNQKLWVSYEEKENGLDILYLEPLICFMVKETIIDDEIFDSIVPMIVRDGYLQEAEKFKSIVYDLDKFAINSKYPIAVALEESETLWQVTKEKL